MKDTANVLGFNIILVTTHLKENKEDGKIIPANKFLFEVKSIVYIFCFVKQFFYVLQKNFVVTFINFFYMHM